MKLNGSEEIGVSSAWKGNQGAADWRGLFSASVDQVLQFYPPQKSNGKVFLPQEVIEEGVSYW